MRRREGDRWPWRQRCATTVLLCAGTGWREEPSNQASVKPAALPTLTCNHVSPRVGKKDEPEAFRPLCAPVIGRSCSRPIEAIKSSTTFFSARQV